MPIVTTIPADPRPVAVSAERRTNDLRIISDRGGQTFLVASRELVVLDASGNPIGLPEPQAPVRRDFTPQFFAANPAIHALFDTLMNQIDVWESEGDPTAHGAPPVTLSKEQKIAILTAAVQKVLDDTARTRNYDGIVSACSYAASTNPTFKAEGKLAVAWRDAVWSFCYELLADVEAGLKPEPTVDSLIASLPTIGW